MSFWDTVLGHQLAETLVRELPKLNRKKKQETFRLKDEESDAYLSKAINEDGYRFAGSYVDSKGVTVVVLEK